MRSLKELARPNIRALKAYSSARDEYKGFEAHVFLDANESPYNSPLNRYPDPLQQEVKAMIVDVRKRNYVWDSADKNPVTSSNLFLGNGSDEAIDLLFRAFCEPRIDNAVAIDPSYGMYEVCAETNDIAYRKVSLTDDFEIDVDAILAATDEQTKLLFICSPNNPTGNLINVEKIQMLLENYDGLVIIDEAYVDFGNEPSWLTRLDQYDKLVVLQTMSKAWGCAGIRLGMAWANDYVIELFSKIKYPYNVNKLTQEAAKIRLMQEELVRNEVKQIVEERENMRACLKQLPMCLHIYPSQANFLLVKFTDADGLYRFLVQEGIIVRNRNRVHRCAGCLRLTVGTKAENEELMTSIKSFK
ncbi:MAG: histidinol-phosphate transaminase [Bacteroidaceae bacterium]